MSKLVLVDAISTFYVRYAVETSDNEVDQAIDEVRLGKYKMNFHKNILENRLFLNV